MCMEVCVHVDVVVCVADLYKCATEWVFVCVIVRACVCVCVTLCVSRLVACLRRSRFCSAILCLPLSSDTCIKWG